MVAVISTWKMSFDGASEALARLQKGSTADEAVIEGIKVVESDLNITSVGTGGLPNEEGVIQLDGSFMDGRTLQFGAVGAVEDIPSAVELAHSLVYTPFNNFLVGKGAQKEAVRQGVVLQDISSEKSKNAYIERGQIQKTKLESFNDHDTVGMITLDETGHMIAATSTSGLFMKKDGRLGDSPIIGSGFYADDEVGACTATGVGEDIMKGVLSYEIVRRMAEGMHPQQAAETAVFELDEKLARRVGRVNSISVVCMNNKGEWGVGTNCPFVFNVSVDGEIKLYYADVKDHKVIFSESEIDLQKDTRI